MMTKLARLPALGAAAVLGMTAVAGAALAPAPAEAQAARRDPQAEAFVQTQTQRALTILNNRALSVPQKAAQFRTFVDQVADVPAISARVLGKYSRTITPAQRTEFNRLFRGYASSVYESQLDEYRGETIRVTGSEIIRPNEALVSTVLSGGQVERPRQIQWQVRRGRDGSWRVLDARFAGVSLAVTQQQAFVSCVDNAGGNINVLLNYLRTPPGPSNPYCRAS